MLKIKPRVIIGSSSLFLDTLRICAAFTVLYIHAFDRWFPTKAHPEYEPGEPSHAAVIIFFVLSGYVIAHTTISKNRGGAQYAQARLSRLCSVVIPALVITAVIQFVIGYLNPELLMDYSRSHSGVRYVLSGFFVNEVWLFSAAPPLNGSLWSLSFEFWYYAIFGLWFFRRGGWKSFILPVLACIIAGPKILLMMPVWLAGYVAYILPRPSVKTVTAWLMVAGGLLLAWLAVEFVPSYPYRIGYVPLYYANQFVTDWVVGVFIAAALWILPTGNSLSADLRISAWVRKIADLTFPLYVLHFPLLVLWRAVFGFRLNDATQLWEVIISVVIASLLIGVILEKQRHLWSAFFKWLVGNAKDKVAAGSAAVKSN
ncbi:acyltransferase family protein [Mucilaginibacter segetis]|uniref:Acyltransferase n=1 Tax=Mucilaginibacter segetis TaxID=2793071 RepID=A0A934UP87_9SPHI|nr:acyltransferase [Mucilaginibacter segetis]MBK0380661.1 acyltransferase [Mucilaginibacter segetis]